MHLKLKFNYIANSSRITIIQIFLYLEAQIVQLIYSINMDFYVCILDNLTSEFFTRFDAGEYFDFYQNCSQYF